MPPPKGTKMLRRFLSINIPSATAPEQDQDNFSSAYEKYSQLTGLQTTGTEKVENGSMPNRRWLYRSTPQLMSHSEDRELFELVLARSPEHGFGIAVSGGVDEPPIAPNDRSIYISDVVRAGPADGKLQLLDRLESVNGVSLGQVENATAVRLLRDSGDLLSLVVRRRAERTLTLTRHEKKHEYGIVLASKLYVQRIIPNSPAALNGGVSEGDEVIKLNNRLAASLSLTEARKLVEKSGDRLQMTLSAPPPASAGDLTGSRYSATSSTAGTPHYATLPPPSYGRLSVASLDSASQQTDPSPPAAGDSSSTPTPLTNGHIPSAGDVSHSLAAVNDMISSKPVVPSTPSSSPRFVSFDKEDSMGVRLAGGNATGIYVLDVQPGSPSHKAGVLVGDQVVKVDGEDLAGLTREKAVLILLQTRDHVGLVLQYRPGEMRRSLGQQEAGDSLYVRCHFDHVISDANSLSFRRADVLHVTDTLFTGAVGTWFAAKLGRNNVPVSRGSVPNENRGEQLQLNQSGRAGSIESGTSTLKKSRLFKSKPRRAKSVGREHFDDLQFSASDAPWAPYEQVELRVAAHTRPLILYGPLADVARKRLCSEQGHRFAPPASSPLADAFKQRSHIMKLQAIREVADSGRHCVLELTPQSTDKLNYVGLVPIVIYLKADSRAQVRELRSRLAPSSAKSVKRLMLDAEKISADFSHLFTAVVTLTSGDVWFHRLCHLVESQQAATIWQASSPQAKPLQNDILFSLLHRQSYASESDTENDVVVKSPVHTVMSNFATLPRKPLVPKKSAWSTTPIPLNTAPPRPAYELASESDVFDGGSAASRQYPSYYARDKATIDTYATVGRSRRSRTDRRFQTLPTNVLDPSLDLRPSSEMTVGERQLSASAHERVSASRGVSESPARELRASSPLHDAPPASTAAPERSDSSSGTATAAGHPRPVELFLRDDESPPKQTRSSSLSNGHESSRINGLTPRTNGFTLRTVPNYPRSSSGSESGYTKSGELAAPRSADLIQPAGAHPMSASITRQSRKGRVPRTNSSPMGSIPQYPLTRSSSNVSPRKVMGTQSLSRHLSISTPTRQTSQDGQLPSYTKLHILPRPYRRPASPWQEVNNNGPTETSQQPEPAQPLDLVRAVLGPAGGRLVSEKTSVTLTVPPGALERTHSLYFKVHEDAGTAGHATPVVMCGPPGLQFRSPVTLELPRSLPHSGETMTVEIEHF